MPTDGLKWGESPTHQAPNTGSLAIRTRKSDERNRRVEAFRAAVTAGTYQVDSFMVADRLLDQHVLERDDE